MSAADDLRWFLDHQDSPPSRIHDRGVWRVPAPDGLDPQAGADAGKGSLIGSPAIAHSFARWIERTPNLTRVERVEEPCYHAGRPEGQLCTVCGVRDHETGAILYESGVRVASREYYCWPMRLALSRLAHARIPRGYPNYTDTLRAIAAHGGDVDRAIEVLSRQYLRLADPSLAALHVRRALQLVRFRYATEKPYYPARRLAA
jgi:hypothetical protein